jgi:hypothetical protein
MAPVVYGADLAKGRPKVPLSRRGVGRSGLAAGKVHRRRKNHPPLSNAEGPLTT